MTIRRTIAIIGHSNADGWAGTTDLFRTAGHLAPTASPENLSVRNVWRGIYVATSQLPWPGLEGTPMPTSISDVAWLTMTHNLPLVDADTHPHASPYRYPNIRGAAYPNWMHQATPNGGGTFCGAEIPLMWMASHYYGADEDTGVGLIKMAFSSSLFLRFDGGGGPSTWFDAFGFSALTPWPDRPRTTVDPSYGYFGWWTPADQFDWAPTTGRFYQSFIDKAIASKEAMPNGVTMSLDTVVVWMGDNDSTLNLTQEDRIRNWEKYCREFIKKLRADIAANELSTLPAHQVKIVWMGVNENYGVDSDTMNAALERIAADDPWMRVIDTDDYQMLSELGYVGQPLHIVVGTTTHFSHNAYLQAAEDIMDAIADMDVAPFDAIDEDNRITVEEAMARVRTYYSRSRTNTDIDDTTVLQHLNGALFHVINHIGDSAWWLRRRLEFTLSPEPQKRIVTLPKVVHRLIRVEGMNDARYPLHWEEVGRTGGGKLQIVVSGGISGTYTLHFITQPREMTRDDELVPLPQQMIEWMIVEAARRLARSSGNVALQASLEGESRQLQVSTVRNAGLMQQGRNDRAYTQRRLPTRRMGITRTWARDSSR